MKKNIKKLLLIALALSFAVILVSGFMYVKSAYIDNKSLDSLKLNPTIKEDTVLDEWPCEVLSDIYYINKIKYVNLDLYYKQGWKYKNNSVDKDGRQLYYLNNNCYQTTKNDSNFFFGKDENKIDFVLYFENSYSGYWFIRNDFTFPNHRKNEIVSITIHNTENDPRNSAGIDDKLFVLPRIIPNDKDIVIKDKNKITEIVKNNNFRSLKKIIKDKTKAKYVVLAEFQDCSIYESLADITIE